MSYGISKKQVKVSGVPKIVLPLVDYRPFRYSKKESESNDILLHFIEFSNVHNSDRSSKATRSNLAYKNDKNNAFQSMPFSSSSS